MRISAACLALAVALLALARTEAAGGADAIGKGPTPAVTPAGVPVISDAEAGAHVGEDVTVEGRIHATHVSQLATVLAFAPNFTGFTATVHAADRDRFPADLADRARNRLVRVRGVVTSYRGRPEMTLKNARQLEYVDAEPPAPVAAPSGPPTPAALPAELTDALARIEARLDALESRLGDLESAGPVADAEPPPPFPVVGMPAAQLRPRLGEPIKIEAGLRGRRVWVYGGGRSVDVDAAGYVLGWSGF